MQLVLGTAVLGGTCLWSAAEPHTVSAADVTAANALRPERRFSFTYNVEVGPLEKGKPADIFIPLAKSNDQQSVARAIHSSVSGKEQVEPEYGNEFYHIHIPSGNGETVTATVNYDVTRKLFRRELTAETAKAKYAPGETDKYKRFLQADSLVPVSGPLVEKVQKDLPPHGDSPQEIAKAIYDYVVTTMEYKKVGTGWGTGSTEWACSQKYGNCTDFHALVSSLARANKIPTRFEIGFSVPEDKESGDIAGYHCWAELYLPQVGWTPIDASDAKKYPERKDLLFGAHPVDRVQLTIGRDITLGAGHSGKPLNFFVYPYVEVDGVALPKEAIKTSFSFAERK